MHDEKGRYTTIWSGGLEHRKEEVFVTWGENLLLKAEACMLERSFVRTLPTQAYEKASQSMAFLQGKRKMWYFGAHVHTKVMIGCTWEIKNC